MTITQCPRCGTPLAEGATACTACGWMATDAGMTRVATTDEKSAGSAPTDKTLMLEEQDLLFASLKKELANEYELERELGRGGMAVVYKALERELHRPVALKVLPPGMGGSNMAERFKREARLAAALDHQHIIPVFRVGQAAGTYYFAMKFVEGRAVDAIVESQGALPVPVILQILRASTSALAFAHERSIVHRDIKGANILVDRDGRVMVSDFGIARAAEEKTLTASGSVIGTPHFMSPEQCSGAKVGPQSDQYSLGILAFQMLTGSVPFDADSLMAILQHHFFTPVPDISLVREGVPPLLISIVNRALHKDPAGRYAATKDMLMELEQIPFTDPERREADEMLKKLAVGEPVPKVRTGSLPPLGDTRLAGFTRASASSAAPTVTAPQVPKPAAKPAPRKKKSKAPMIVGGAVVLAAVGGGVAWQMNQRAVARTRAAADSVARLESLRVREDSVRLAALNAVRDSARRADSAKAAAPPAAAPTGRQPRTPPQTQQPPAPTARQTPAAAPAAGSTTLSLRTVPTNADVLLDNRPLQQGGVIGYTISAGRHTLVVRASGCQEFRTTIDAQDGVPVNLHTITLTGCNQ